MLPPWPGRLGVALCQEEGAGRREPVPSRGGFDVVGCSPVRALTRMTGGYRPLAFPSDGTSTGSGRSRFCRRACWRPRPTSTTDAGLRREASIRNAPTDRPSRTAPVPLHPGVLSCPPLFIDGLLPWTREIRRGWHEGNGGQFHVSGQEPRSLSGASVARSEPNRSPRASLKIMTSLATERPACLTRESYSFPSGVRHVIGAMLGILVAGCSSGPPAGSDGVQADAGPRTAVASSTSSTSGSARGSSSGARTSASSTATGASSGTGHEAEGRSG